MRLASACLEGLQDVDTVDLSSKRALAFKVECCYYAILLH